MDRSKMEKFYPSTVEEHHKYNCEVCNEFHLVNDATEEFSCPNTDDENAIKLVGTSQSETETEKLLV